MTRTNPFYCHPAPPKNTPFFNRFNGILRTRRCITTTRWENRTNDDLINSNQQNKRKPYNFLEQLHLTKLRLFCEENGVSDYSIFQISNLAGCKYNVGRKKKEFLLLFNYLFCFRTEIIMKLNCINTCRIWEIKAVFLFTFF